MGVDSDRDEGALREGEGSIDAEVIVVGAGPTGLMLAGELALAGVEVLVVERRPDQALAGSRARGLHARSIEVLDQRGLAEPILAEGQAMQIISMVAGRTLDMSDLPTRHPYGVALGQAGIEAVLAGWVETMDVRFGRGAAVVGVTQDASGAEVAVEGGPALRAQYVVGCDGGRSAIRRRAGIPFTGTDASTSYVLAEVTMPHDPKLGFHEDHRGRHAIGPQGDGGRVAVVVQETPPQAGDHPSIDEVREAVVAIWGTDFGMHSPTWITRFTDAARQAESYRDRRVLLAGDAAHVHSPVGGQGLGTGLQDAANLGWKLAQVVRGTAPKGLLDTYHAERHPVGARVLQGTVAQTALMATDDRTAALRALLADVLELDEPRRHLVGRLSGLDTRYDLGEGHPLLGRRMPDLDLTDVVGADGTWTHDASPVYALLHSGRPLLLDLVRGEEGRAKDADLATAFDGATPWADRVQLVRARYDGPWELPVLGPVDAPPAALVRPDGYVAWAGALGEPGLAAALTRWFGAPA